MARLSLRTLAIALMPALSGSCDPASRPPIHSETEAIHSLFLRGLDSLELALDNLAALPPRPSADSAQAVFRRARTAYKRIEYLVEFDDAFRATALQYVEGPFRGLDLNGPPIPMVDEDDYTNVLEPTGFQVIEAVTFPEPAPEFAEIVAEEVGGMRLTLDQLRAQPAETLEGRRRALDAARLEVARVATLGIAGFDATVSKEALRESAEALVGVRQGLHVYRQLLQQRDPEGWQALLTAIDAAQHHLRTAPSFDDFDRLGFLVHQVIPVTDALRRVERALQLPPSQYTGIWRPGETYIYARNALDPQFFAPDYAPPSSSDLVRLGRDLFFETRLSSTGRRSCATCHRPGLGFADGQVVAEVDSGHGMVRNTPTLINAGLQVFQFADQRARFLEFQVEDVMANQREMAQPVDVAARRLQADPQMVERFRRVFGPSDTVPLTGQRLALAVAAYVRSLVALNSRFDAAARGDTAALTAAERRGFNVFMGKAACGTCHFAPVFGGSVPPIYRESEVEILGVPADTSPAAPTIDGDPGVYEITRASLHRHAFKTPSVRNADLTAPYMHNGVFSTLEQVVEFYDVGGGVGLGMTVPNQTLSPDSLHLSDQEKQDLIDFMVALTDTVVPPGPVQTAERPRAQPSER